MEHFDNTVVAAYSHHFGQGQIDSNTRLISLSEGTHYQALLMHMGTYMYVYIV